MWRPRSSRPFSLLSPTAKDAVEDRVILRWLYLLSECYPLAPDTSHSFPATEFTMRIQAPHGTPIASDTSSDGIGLGSDRTEPKLKGFKPVWFQVEPITETENSQNRNR
jgi:hypothetical protein